MATTPTNLPVPSEAPRDLKFNAGKIDEFVTSLVNTYVDRFGKEHYTIEGLRWLAQQAIAEFGWIPVGTFQAGATLTLPNQLIKDTTDGEYYRWDGSFPKNVPSGSTPSSSGGVGIGAWLSVGDATVRQWVKTNYDESTYQQIQTGNFATGTIITSSFQAVYYPTDSHWYRYLGNIPSGGLVVAANSSPDTNWENVDTQQIISLRKINELSTSSIAGYIGVNIDMPVAVKDSDNQGARVGSGVTIRNDIPTQNAVKTAKIQSAFRLDGDNISLIGLRGVGSAAADNSATSEFITSRMAWSQGRRLKNISIKDVYTNGQTTAVHLLGVDGGAVKNVESENMKYSPTTLNSAGGYCILIGGGTNGLVIDGVKHILRKSSDRHTLYISNTQPYVDVETSGWYNVTARNIFCDWRENTDSNGIFAMSPVHLRAGRGFTIDGLTVLGRAGSTVDLENQHGLISDVTIRNVVARDLTSYANGDLVDTGGIRLGYGQYSAGIQNVSISGCDLKIKRGTGMAAGTDHCVLGDIVDGAYIGDCSFTTESGSSVLLRNCKNITIDSIRDTLIDTTANSTVIELISCSNVYIGNVRTNRGTVADDKTVSFVNCTDITCAFPRIIAFTVTNGVVSSISDRWRLLASVPTLSGNTINVPLLGAVTQDAVDGCRLQLDTMSSAGIVKVSTGSKTVVVGCVNTTTGSPTSSSSVTMRIELHLSR
ncbi:tail fiber/spike domain-containing protein [Kosakonia cowanii]|uniref:tail fiber/spike domain-containing protein n=1 Tax=Kosakonia cowanii TaxID=208223 RepID=UPI0028991269|nr:hypothetical protein [Kosakonia cowanii]